MFDKFEDFGVSPQGSIVVLYLNEILIPYSFLWAVINQIDVFNRKIEVSGHYSQVLG